METMPDCGENKSDAEKEFRESLFAQLEEIMKYKWCLGEKMKRNPLEVMSMDEICLEWIEKYAKEFREYWKRKNAGSAGFNIPES
jgi:hypothetical protein